MVANKIYTSSLKIRKEKPTENKKMRMLVSNTFEISGLLLMSGIINQYTKWVGRKIVNSIFLSTPSGQVNFGGLFGG